MKRGGRSSVQDRVALFGGQKAVKQREFYVFRHLCSLWGGQACPSKTCRAPGTIMFPSGSYRRWYSPQSAKETSTYAARNSV